ncbi:unnamed protein product, partial [Prorocentrum cordatum]
AVAPTARWLPCRLGSVPNITSKEANELSRLPEKAGDEAGASLHSGAGKSLASAEARVKQAPSPQQAVQQQRGQVRRLEKQMETELARLLRFQPEADREYKGAVQKLTEEPNLAASSTPPSVVKLEDLLAGSADTAALTNCDVLEDRSPGDPEERQKRSNAVSLGITDTAKQLFKNAIGQAKAAQAAHAAQRARLACKMRRSHGGQATDGGGGEANRQLAVSRLVRRQRVHLRRQILHPQVMRAPELALRFS